MPRPDDEETALLAEVEATIADPARIRADTMTAASRLNSESEDLAAWFLDLVYESLACGGVSAH